MPLNNGDVRIVVCNDDVRKNGILQLDFSIRLHTIGSDVTFYANTWHPSDEHDKLSADLYNMLRVIFAEGESTGVEQVNVRPYTMLLNCSRAFDSDDIIASLVLGIKDGGLSSNVEVIKPSAFAQ